MYETRDIYEATAILVHYGELPSISKGPDCYFFNFKDDEGAREVSSLYYADNMKVSPLKFVTALKRIKGLIPRNR